MKSTDGPVTAAVREHCRFIMDTAQFLNRLLEPRVADIIALVSELERQADQLAEQLAEEMSEDTTPRNILDGRADAILFDAGNRSYGDRFDAIVDAGFPLDFADLYCRTPAIPKHPNAREVRASIARGNREQREKRNKDRLESLVLTLVRPYSSAMYRWRNEDRAMAILFDAIRDMPPAGPMPGGLLTEHK